MYTLINYCTCMYVHVHVLSRAENFQQDLFFVNFAFYEKMTVLLFTLIDLGNFNPLKFLAIQYIMRILYFQMMSDKEGGGAKGGDRVSDVSDISANNYGVKTTSHPLILLIIKGQ